MKRFLCAGEGYALSKFKNSLYLAFAITTARMIAVYLGLSFLCIQVAQATLTAPASPTGRAVFYFETIHDNFRVLPPQQTTLSGTVVDANGQPIEGVTIAVRGTTVTTSTDAEGRFALTAPAATGVLLISFLGHEPITQRFDAQDAGPFHLTLIPVDARLEEVEVSTGYQSFSEKYATGSYAHVSNEQLNRSVSTNLMDRLANVTSGLLFMSGPLSAGIDPYHLALAQIRGRNTIGAPTEPLIVVDNFPYYGDLGNLHPSDIEDVTVLKDAAAAAAWGARSGNGVIVITTKKGSSGRNMVDLSANTNMIGKPDLYAPGLARLSNAEYIEVEQFLFGQGAYNTRINSGHQALSPAVEIFYATREGQLSSADSARAINSLMEHDFRDDLLRHYYRTAVNQQYHGSVSGGRGDYSYFASAGYDDNLGNVINSANQRVTLNMNHTYALLNGRLKLNAHLVYTSALSERGETLGNIHPYERMTDENGNARAVVNSSANLRLVYADTVGVGRLLDWNYRPLDELRLGPITESNRRDYRINANVQYRILDELSIALRYGYGSGTTQSTTIRSQESFYTRNLINRVTQLSGGTVITPIPRGDIFSSSSAERQSHNGRIQADYNKTWDAHRLSVIGGAEAREELAFNSSYRLYGYNPSTASHQNAAINYTLAYPYYVGSGSTRIDVGSNPFGTVDRFVSMYSILNYGYLDRYLFSASARRDESNIFGVATNQKGVPLWSAGAGWIISEEPFHSIAWLSYIKLRASYGYTGNVDRGLSALLTAQATSNLINTYNVLYANIINPPNPSLRWEKVQNINIGMDFNLFYGRISGSVDLWRKHAVDLIGERPLAPQTGVMRFVGNSAETMARGLDIQLSSNNLSGPLSWTTSLLYSHSRDRLVRYYGTPGNNHTVIQMNSLNPLVNYPYYALFSYQYGGLDEVGDPVAFLDGERSKAYADIYSSMDRDNLVYHGSMAPTHFGNIINDLSWKGIGLSFSLSYRFGYYFRRNSLNNSSIYGSGGAVDAAQVDYGNRWQNPGDELVTDVPALVYPSNLFRSMIYTYSDALVERGDHVRLQDLRLSYKVEGGGRVFSQLQLYGYANNLGILWRANRLKIDPDYPVDIPAARSFAIGLKASF